MFRHELEIARDVQAKLLPENFPYVEHLDCAAFFRPAKFVGGDYYDFIQSPGGKLAFTLGDISGKGIPAAVLMASIQASLRIPLLRGPESLTELLADVNRSFNDSYASMRYSTLFCGLIDAGGRRLTYVNAGQCPPMLVRRRDADVTIERLTTGGTPIGLLPVAQYEEATVTLEPGDLLVCYSDGVSEAANASGDFWPESEIEALVRATANLSPREVTDRLIQGADAFAGEAEQADDMTVVTLRAR
jgi:sigma-B regulation protein RsbU (phosphoserine phosphatase)